MPKTPSATLVVPGITDHATLACLSRARRFSQYRKAVENAFAGICPFCQIDWNYNQKVTESSYWFVWHCQPPENNTRLHLLIVPKRHITDSCSLTDTEVLEKHRLQKCLVTRFRLSSWGILCRDGNATFSAGTIQHLHFHMMVPAGTGRVESPFYKGTESEAEGVARAIVFEKMRQLLCVENAEGWGRDVTEKLTPEERELVKDRLD